MHTDIAVVGAGPAGLLAATVAASAGAGVLLLEERSWTGGRLGLQTQPLQGPRSMFQARNGVELCERLLEDATSAGAKVILDSAVSHIRCACSEPPILTLGITPAGGDAYELTARAVVIATGSSEPRPSFPGSTLVGVMLSGDAQIMLTVRRKLPGRRVLMVGSDNAALLIAANLLAAGAHVVAVVEESPRILGREINAASLLEAGVDMLPSTRVVAARGRRAVDSATVARIDSAGAVLPGTENSFAVDAICLAGARAPESRLAAQTGSPLRDAAVFGGPVPVHNRRMATPVAGIYVCGDAAGVENGAVSLETGRLAGLSSTGDLGFVHPRAASLESLARGRLGYLRRGRRGLLRRRARAALASEYGRIERIKGTAARDT